MARAPIPESRRSFTDSLLALKPHNFVVRQLCRPDDVLFTRANKIRLFASSLSYTGIAGAWCIYSSVWTERRFPYAEFTIFAVHLILGGLQFVCDRLDALRFISVLVTSVGCAAMVVLTENGVCGSITVAFCTQAATTPLLFQDRPILAGVITLLNMLMIVVCCYAGPAIPNLYAPLTRRESLMILLLGASMVFFSVTQSIQVYCKGFKELEAVLADAVASKQRADDFLSSMSHELRTPLNCMIGDLPNLEHLLGCPSPEVKDVCRRMKASSNYLLTLINDTLDLAKFRAGFMKFSATATDVRLLFVGCMEMFAWQICQQGIT